MALSDTARRILTEAGQHDLRLDAPLKHLPSAACNAALRNMLKGREYPALPDFLRAHQPRLAAAVSRVQFGTAHGR